MAVSLTKDLFIEKAFALYGNKYVYGKSKYTNNKQNITITCLQHGDFNRSPSAFLRGFICKGCLNQIKNNNFINQAKLIHKNKYCYTETFYEHSMKKVKIKCSVHGLFFQKPNDHLNGRGCPKCKGEKNASRQSHNINLFVKKARNIHGKLYDYSKAKYKNARTLIVITCKNHGDFTQTPNVHLAGRGCLKCKPRGFSKIAIKWIEETSKKLNMKNVQHAMNKGEYRLPGTRIKVDGYHGDTQTVFEFHGDAFHGNLEKYKLSEKCHPYSTLTAASLYVKTMERERIIIGLGYNLISIWESDYKESIK